MLKTLYDTECVTWSPQGKLFQVDYAMEAVKLGSICLGLRSKTDVVLCSLKRSQSELSGYQEKIFKVDNHIGMAIAGLTADARLLCKYMRNECLNHKYIYESDHPLNRLIFKVAEKSQGKTQVMNKRPFGVGLLIAGLDQDGPHLYETCPDGNYYEYHAYSIGARSQSARTYFENNLNKFSACDLNKLVLHGLKALRSAVQEEADLTSKSVEIAYVGANTPFRYLSAIDIEKFLKDLETFKPEDEMEMA